MKQASPPRVPVIAVLALTMIGTCLPLPTCPPAQGQDAAITIAMRDGTQRTGQLQAIHAGGVVLSANRALGLAEATIPLQDVERITLAGKATEAPFDARVTLRDGTQLPAADLQLANRELAFRLANFDMVSVPTRIISDVVLQASNLRDATELAKLILETRLDQDALIVDRDNQYRALEGIVQQIDSEQLTVTIGEQTAQVPRGRITAVKFFHAQPAASNVPLAMCGLNNGALVSLARLEQTADRIRLTSPGGLELELPAAALTFIHFPSSNVVDLGSLTLISNDWQPLLANRALVSRLRDLNRAQFDKSFDGEPLTLESRIRKQDGSGYDVRREAFGRGLAIQAGGRVVFRLDGQFQTLTGKLGFDPQADDNGSVRVQIITDEHIAFEADLKKQASDSPLDLEVPVKQCSRLEIHVDYADGRSIGDQIHFVDPQLSK